MQPTYSNWQKIPGLKEFFTGDSVMHNSGDECFDLIFHRQEIDSLEEFLDSFNSPVLLVDREGIVHGSNQMACLMLDKVQEDIRGLFIGEVLECINARLQEGCGGGVACTSCTMRNLIEKTLIEQESFHWEAVQLTRDDGIARMLLSTRYKKNLVALKIEEIFEGLYRILDPKNHH